MGTLTWMTTGVLEPLSSRVKVSSWKHNTHLKHSTGHVMHSPEVNKVNKNKSEVKGYLPAASCLSLVDAACSTTPITFLICPKA